MGKENDEKIFELIKRMLESEYQTCRNVRDRLDLQNGWKFAEDDKDFLIKYYTEYADVLRNCCEEDGLEEVWRIINSIKQHGVNQSKELIQEDAISIAESVQWEIYEYYKDNKDILKLIENSILL